MLTCSRLCVRDIEKINFFFGRTHEFTMSVIVLHACFTSNSYHCVCMPYVIMIFRQKSCLNRMLKHERHIFFGKRPTPLDWTLITETQNPNPTIPLPEIRSRLKGKQTRGRGSRLENGSESIGPYPSGKHRGGAARDCHASPTKVVSRSSSSHSPFPSSIYATLRKRSRKTPIFQEAREATRHRLTGAFGVWMSSSDSD